MTAGKIEGWQRLGCPVLGSFQLKRRSVTVHSKFEIRMDSHRPPLQLDSVKVFERPHYRMSHVRCHKLPDDQMIDQVVV